MTGGRLAKNDNFQYFGVVSEAGTSLTVCLYDELNPDGH
jgi:hypothetical protein